MHSWERPKHSWDRLASAAAPSAGDPDGQDAWGELESDSDLDEVGLSPQGELIDFCTDLLMLGVLNARQFCVLMYRAGRCDLAECAKYGLSPHSSSGHYHRKLDTMLGYKSNNRSLYHVDVPGHSNAEMSRATLSVPVILPHEAMSEALRNDDSYRVKLATAVASSSLPPCYYKHPVVARAPEEERVGAISVYCDAVPYAINDSVLGIWTTSEISEHRFLFAVLRKKRLCRCGCRGWCSFYAVFRCLAWSLRALATREMPARRHDLQPWQWSDIVNKRSVQGGAQLPYRMALLYVRGDWSEYSNTLGFPSWNDSLRPCFCCTAHGEDLFNFSECEFENLQWKCNHHNDYNAACARCELVVVIPSQEVMDEVSRKLRWDKRSRGGRGRTLKEPIECLNLLADDRLEPCDSLADVALLEDMVIPCTVVFWRSSRESIARHRCPLFCTELGLSPDTGLIVDTLHCLYLGIMLVWCRLSFWCLMTPAVTGNVGNAEENLASGFLVVKSLLHFWYAEYHAGHAHDPLTRLHDVSRKIFGKPAEQKCKTKGAETWGLCLFLVDMLQKHAAAVGARGRRLRLAGLCLISIVRSWRRSERIVPLDARKSVFEAYLEHLRLMAPENVFLPKHHLFLHLLCKTGEQGNPTFFATWEDESWNRQLKASCKNASQACFENTVLTNMQRLLQDGGRKRKSW